MKHRKSTLIAACAAAGLMASGAEARELIYGSWVSPKHGINVDALPPMFKGVAKDTNGAITWKLVPGGALVKGFTTLSGIRDGLIDAGLAIAVFSSKNTPSTALIHSTLVAGDDNVATTGAQNETVIPGDSPSYTFREAYNSMGASKSGDFLGKPVLVDFWGTK